MGALVIPQLAEIHGIAAALLFTAIVCAAAAVISGIGVLDPPRPPRAEAHADDLANPYRGSSTLWRIHAVSVLLVAPQLLVWTFALVWLMVDRGWSAASAGATGHRRPNPRRRRPDRRGPMVGQGRFPSAPDQDDRHRRGHRDGAAGIDRSAALPVGVAVMVVASVITVSDNGLAFTAIAEIAGPFWSGRALGTQNTAQLLTGGIVPPVFGALITAAGYPLAFAVCALFPLIALPLVPVERRPMRSPARPRTTD